jgi:hypothetical protein
MNFLDLKGDQSGIAGEASSSRDEEAPLGASSRSPYAGDPPPENWIEDSI